ncbi:hypothetical protein EPUL_006128, partial [Erysiphe pulchra]
MSSNYSTSFKKPVESLSKSNWRQVFVELKLWFESKGLFYTLTAAVAALHVKKEEKPDHKGQENQLGIINYERSSQWDRDSSAVMYWLRQCCFNDLDTIEDNITPKRVWNALYTKYSKVKAVDLRKFEREITAFNRESQAPGKSLEECFEMFKALRRRFLLLKPGKKESLSNEDLFGYLLDGLTEDEWKLTKDNVDAQPNLDYQGKQDILQRFFENTPLLLANKSELSKKMNELSLMLEKQSGEEILAGRSDNAPEIIKLFGEWKSKRGIVPQTTAPYNSNQNGTAERGIQSSEREARALLEDSGMPVEFWDYAVESGAYV